MKKLIYILAGFLIFSTSCTDNFEEINDNPNAAKLDQADMGMLLTNGIESMTDRVHEIFIGHEMGSCWVQHMAKVQYTDEDKYIPRVSVINNTWNSFYGASGADIALMYEVAVAKGNENFQGVALVLQAYITSVITDLYGDAPYSQAWKGSSAESIVNPTYDSQEAIYTALLADLETANTLLDVNGDAIYGDILYNNNIGRWKKFANTLRIRLAMRISDRLPAVTTDILNTIISDPTKYPVFEGNGDNARLVYLGSAPNNNPINENRKTRDDHRVSATLIDMLYTNTPSADYRVALYANLADGSHDFVGIPNGMEASDAANYLGNGLKETSKIGSFYSAATAPGMLMSYSEFLFFLSEAAVKVYIGGGDAVAQGYYEDAIEASYNQNAAALTPLLEDYWGSTFVSWGWNPDSDTTIVDYAFYDFRDWGGFTWTPAADKIELIATQKWVALFDQGIQAWIEWRRLDYPVLTPAVAGVLSGDMPIRVNYPSDEYARNPLSVKAAAAKLAKDDLLTPVWWDINDYNN